MKIGIISDSHDHHVNALKAVEIFKTQNVRYILHAGDMVSPFTAKVFGNVTNAKFIAIFGNNDGEKFMLKSVIEDYSGQIHQDPYHGEIDGKKIFMTHKPSILDEVIASQKYDIIVYGHTHIKDIRTEGKTLVINPGEATDWVSGRGGVCILDTEDMNVTEFEL